MQNLLTNLHNLFVAASNRPSLKPSEFFLQLRSETEYLSRVFDQWAAIPMTKRGPQFKEEVISCFTSLLDYEDELHQIREPYATNLSVAVVQLKTALYLYFDPILEALSESPRQVVVPVTCIPKTRIIELLPSNATERQILFPFWHRVIKKVQGAALSRLMGIQGHCR